MSEPEDVLLEAAARVGAATRALWAREGAAGEAGKRRRAAAQRRLAAWLAAAFGVAPPIHPSDPPPPPGWVERTLGRPAPWRRQAVAVAFTDGVRIFLPRPWLEGEDALQAQRLLLAALAQGRRVAAGAGDLPPPGSPLERDVRFAVEAALGDAELAAHFPGLRAAIEAARHEGRAARPVRAALSAPEQRVETLVQELLAAPAQAARATVEALVGGSAAPGAVCAFARRVAAHAATDPGAYRGMAPVEHWGVAGEPEASDGVQLAGEPGAARRRGRPASRRLPRHVRRRALEDDEQSARPGPFVLPHGDPQLAVQDARGVQRPEDRAGEEELEPLAEEIARAGELPVVRDARQAREILDPEATAARGAGEPAPGAAGRGRAFTYPEWDARIASYRDPGIVLWEQAVLDADAAWAARVGREHHVLLAHVRRHFQALRPRREWIGRRLEGDLVDVDGVVDDHAEHRAGATPSGRIYAREQPRRREVAVLLLLDASGSTDAPVSRGERVIDVAKQATLCLGEALAALGDRLAIHAFSGRGPNDVRVHVAKRFAEPWSEAVRGRLGALQPDRATRLGGPIRHATAELAREPARVRLLLVLSDGRPDDEDVYEGDYGLADVRQAVGEARRAGVHPFCVTIDRSAPAYLPRLFGPAGFTVMWDVRQLPARLPAIYRKLAVA